MKLCSCLLESMYCLKKCPGVHPTFDKYYYSVPSRKNTISAEYARCPQHNYNIPIPANKCSIQNKHTLLNKTNLPLGQCSVFLQGQYPNKIWRIPWTVAPCPLKECNVHFQMSNPPLKGAVSLWKKIIFLHNTCSIIDIEHPFQSAMCLKLWALSKSALSLLTTYWPVWQKIFLWRSSILGKLDYLCLTCVLFPLVRSAQPSFRQLRLPLKDMLSILSNNNVLVESNISLISRGCCTK